MSSARITFEDLQKKYPGPRISDFKEPNEASDVYLRAMRNRISSGKLTGGQIADAAKLIEDATTIWDDGEPKGVTTLKSLSSRLGKVDRDLGVLHRAYIRALNDERESSERWGLSFLTMMRCQQCGTELVWFAKPQGHRCPSCPIGVGTGR